MLRVADVSSFSIAWTEQTCLQACTMLAWPTAMQSVRGRQLTSSTAQGRLQDLHA